MISAVSAVKTNVEETRTIFSDNPKLLLDAEKKCLNRLVTSGAFKNFAEEIITRSEQVPQYDCNYDVDHYVTNTLETTTWFVALWQRLSPTHQFALQDSTFKKNLKNNLINRLAVTIEQCPSDAAFILDELLYPLSNTEEKSYQRQLLNQSDRLDILKQLTNKLPDNVSLSGFISAIQAHLLKLPEALGDWTIFLAQEEKQRTDFYYIYLQHLQNNTHQTFCPASQESIEKFCEAIKKQLSNREPQTNKYTHLLIKSVLNNIVAILQQAEMQDNGNISALQQKLSDILRACSSVLKNNKNLQQHVVNDEALLNDLGEIFVRIPPPHEGKRTGLSGLLATRKMANKKNGEKAFSNMLVNKAREYGTPYETTFAYWTTQQPLTLAGLVTGTKVSGRVQQAIDEHFATSEPLNFLKYTSTDYHRQLLAQTAQWGQLSSIEKKDKRAMHPILIHNLQEAIRHLPILSGYEEYIQFDVSNDSFREYLIKKVGELERYSEKEQEELFLTRFKALSDMLMAITEFQQSDNITQTQQRRLIEKLTKAAKIYKGKPSLHDTMGKHIERIQQVPFFEVKNAETAEDATVYLQSLERNKFDPAVAYQICALLDTPLIQGLFEEHFVKLTTKNSKNVTFSDYLKEKARDGKLANDGKPKHLNGIIEILLLLTENLENAWGSEKTLPGYSDIFTWRQYCEAIGRTTINEYITVQNLPSARTSITENKSALYQTAYNKRNSDTNEYKEDKEDKQEKKSSESFSESFSI